VIDSIDNNCESLQIPVGQKKKNPKLDGPAGQINMRVSEICSKLEIGETRAQRIVGENRFLWHSR